MISARDIRRAACAAVALACSVANATNVDTIGAQRAATIDGFTMGTSYAIRIASLPGNLDVERIRTDVAHILDELDRSMSTYRRDSELSRFNAQPSTDWVPVSADLRTVVAAALEVSRLSGGAFDVTVGPLVDLWGFGPSRGARGVPAAADVDGARALVGRRQLAERATPPAIRKLVPGVRVDLSAIAKGFAVDRVAERLAALGVDGFLVEIGGEVRVHGGRTPTLPWQVAIQRPSGEVSAAETVIALDAGAVATSGSYRNYFDADGHRYAHVIDPRTGRPVEHRLVSVSVVDATAMRADALATALLVLGPADGPAWAEEQGIAALFVTARESGFADVRTPGFERYANR